MKHLEKAWLQYSQAVMPPEAPKVQRTEMRRSFYAGAAMILETLIIEADPGDEPTDKDMAMMESIQTEIEEFLKSVKEGRA